MWWLVLDHRRCNLDLEVVAVLPEFLRRTRILEQNAVDVEGVELAGAVAIDSLTNAGDKVSQRCWVVLLNHRARCSSRGLV
jgi:hypothetical protein